MKMCIVLLVINSVLLILSLFCKEISIFNKYLKFNKWFKSQFKNIKDVNFDENLYLTVSFSAKNEREIFDKLLQSEISVVTIKENLS